MGVVMLPILILLAILYVSYRQTIQAYPANGGAYTVSKVNLGTKASLIAAAALMIDYILTVAVGISAGVGALVSAVPTLHHYTLTLCLIILVVVTGVNLRGVIDAGRAWALPTYLFVASFVVILAIGTYKSLVTHGQPEAVMPLPASPAATETVGVWLLLQSFAAGCTAMTGVEAVSNGVSAFREPVVKRAHRTLGAICAILGLLLAGITYLVRTYHIAAMYQTQENYQSVLSQLAGAVIGHGIFYYVAIGSVLCVLCLSANTSFVDFPRVCRLVAQDDFLPRPFAAVGRRLVFSVGILYLAVAAGVLLVMFEGITDRLIPLYAIGAFLTFTMSQLGMTVHWHSELNRTTTRRDRHKHRARLTINAVGAAATSVALAIMIFAKFTHGAWITLLVIPFVIFLLRMTNRYYRELDAQLRDEGRLDLRLTQPPVVVVLTDTWNRLTDRAVQFALQLSPDVIAVHVTKLGGPDVQEQRRLLRRQWSDDVEAPAREVGLRAPRLVLLDAPLRRMEGPLLQFIAETEKKNPFRQIAVLIPEVVKEHWWQYLLHGQGARRLRAALLRYGGSRVVLINIPWYLEEPRVEEGLEQEEIRNTRGGTQTGG
jgi:amino acid transporter